MKKILLSAAAVIAMFSVSPSAHANSATSTHDGLVNATCHVVGTDGALTPVAGVGLTSQVTSSSVGTFATTCNTATSSLTVTVDTALFNGNAMLPAVGTATFNLDNGSGAYAAAGTAPLPVAGTGYVATYTTVGNLSNGFLVTPSVMDVKARVDAPTGTYLQAGTYKVIIKATTSP
jgi:hypothetical protein